jgi:uracil-DNA glycosylase
VLGREGTDGANELTELAGHIKKRFGDSCWLFPCFNGVKGFFGTGFCEKYGKKIMFVAERPSNRRKKNKSKDKPLMLFYEMLKRFHLENAHLTDFIKTRAKAGEWSCKDLEESIDIFDEEFEIVNPDVVIAIGGQSFHWLCFYLLKKKNIKLYKIMHYSQRQKVENYKDKFTENFQKIVAEISDSR